jgi:uncharacterized protein YoaH (UPF0181 family)
VRKYVSVGMRKGEMIATVSAEIRQKKTEGERVNGIKSRH